MEKVYENVEQVDYPNPKLAELVQCPYGYYADIRENHPVHRLPSGDYVISRYEDCIEVVNRPEDFSNRFGPAIPGFAEASGVELDSGLDAEIDPWPSPLNDAPHHTKKRALLLALVRRDRMVSYSAMIQKVVDQLIDQFASRGAVEFRSEFGEQLPALVILKVFGVPDKDEALIRSWMSKFQGHAFRHSSALQQKEQIDAVTMAKEYFSRALTDRVSAPREDFLSDLVQAKLSRDGTLHMHALLSEIIVGYQAAIHNTVNMIVNTMYLLLRHPDQMARVLAEPAMLQNAIEEALRLASPVQWIQRIAARDVEMHGVTIPKGSLILLHFGSANHDPAKFSEPEEFRIDRPNIHSHLAFGYGGHKCLGMPLARLEARIAFERLFSRLKNFRFAQGKSDVRYLYSPNKRALEALHVQFDPA